MGIHREALTDLIKRYLNIWRSVWVIRNTLTSPYRDKDEQEFLPAHLELTETPVSKTVRHTVWLIICFTVIALIWAFISELDIVAVASGRTVPNGQSKLVQSLETAEVKRILVADGQNVKKGQILIELAALGSDTDVEQAQNALQAAYLNQARFQSLLKALETNALPNLSDYINHLDTSINTNDKLSAELLLAQQYNTWRNEDQQLKARIHQNEAEAKMVMAEIDKLEKLSKIEQKRTQNLSQLSQQKFIAEHVYLEQKSKSIAYQKDLLSKKSQLERIKASIDESKQNRQANLNTLRRDSLDALRQTDESIKQITAQLDKAKQRQKLMRLASPVDGTVQQLTIHTVGGVVTAAQPILVVVPNDYQLHVNVLILNKDIGFIKKGQEAAIKIEAFPYTRYGYLTAKVNSISYDAIENEQLGLVYAATLILDKDTLVVEGQTIRLGAGMNVTAEIKTGKRRVLDYLLSPLKTTLDNSLKQR